MHKHTHSEGGREGDGREGDERERIRDRENERQRE